VLAEGRDVGVTQQLPYVDYLTLDPPHLVANECESCAARYLDRRNACARCGHDRFVKRDLANSGVVRAFTIVRRATPGVTVPYVSAVVDLDGGGVVKANLIGVDPRPEVIEPGMRVELTTFGVGADSVGNEAIAFGYRPLEVHGV
jgi:uncharacterized OB-fold protein